MNAQTDTKPAQNNTQPGSHRHQAVLNVLVPLVLTLISIVVVLEVGLRKFYQLIPLGVCASDPIVGYYFCQPYFEYDKPVRIAYRYKPGFKMEGYWDPANAFLANSQNEVAPTGRDDSFWYVFETDEMGFPNSEYEWRDAYDVIVTGDSFVTRSAPRTWIELLAEQTGKSVLTLGASSWSTPSEVEAVKMYGLDKHPDWVVLMFFEGNDLFNTAQYIKRRESGLSWKEYDFHNVPVYRRLLTYHLLKYGIDRLTIDKTMPSTRYRYPVTASTEAGDVPTVLKDIHLLPLSADYDTLARSDEFAYVKDGLIDLNDRCAAQGTRLLFVYIPSKEHVYWSRIWDSTDVNNILERTVTVTLSEGDHGTLQWNPPYLSYETFNANHNAQERLFADMAAETGIEFLNLTPIFWEDAIQHGELYNYADPHWNQAGNQLAADAIAAYITGQ